MHRKSGYIFEVDNSIFLLLSIIAFVFPIIDNEFKHDIFVTVAYTLVLLSIFSIIGSRFKWMKYIVIVGKYLTAKRS